MEPQPANGERRGVLGQCPICVRFAPKHLTVRLTEHREIIDAIVERLRRDAWSLPDLLLAHLLPLVRAGVPFVDGLQPVRRGAKTRRNAA